MPPSFIHAADGRAGLLRGFPGSPDPRMFGSWQEFCAECHGGNLVARSPHRGGEKSCAFCHPSKPKRGHQEEVISRKKDLCMMCHGTITRQHYDDADPLGQHTECASCHDPHGKSGENPSLLNSTFLAAAKASRSVRPHFRKAFCFVCHENVDDYALLSEDVNELCNRCHASCHQTTGAVAVDMETAAVAAEAAKLSLPCLSLRVVLGTVDEHLPQAPRLAPASGQRGSTPTRATGAPPMLSQAELLARLNQVLAPLAACLKAVLLDCADPPWEA